MTNATYQEFLTDMMNSIVLDAEQFTAAGRISWGSKDQKVVGVMADGTRCDVNGNVLLP